MKPTVSAALAAEVTAALHRVGRHWKINDKLVLPTEQDVQQTLDKMIAVLYDKNYTQITVGGLLVMRNGDHFDVYTHIGETK